MFSCCQKQPPISNLDFPYALLLTLINHIIAIIHYIRPIHWDDLDLTSCWIPYNEGTLRRGEYREKTGNYPIALKWMKCCWILPESESTSQVR